jgi:hypothetical protein
MGFTRVTPSGKTETVLFTFGQVPADRALTLFDLVRDELGLAGFEAPDWDDDAAPAEYPIEIVRKWRAQLALALAPKRNGEQLRAFARATRSAYQSLTKTLFQQARLVDAFPSVEEEAADHVEEMVEEYADMTSTWPFEYWASREPQILINMYVSPILDDTPLSYARSHVDAVDAEYLLIVLNELQRDLATCDAEGTSLRFAWT